MKFCRFVPLDRSASSALYGILDSDQVREISGAPWAEWSQSSRVWPLPGVRLVAPVDPSKIVCIAGQPVGQSGTTNMLKLHRVGESLS